MTQQEWVDLISPIAVKVCKEYGYLPSVLTAQTCQETGYGTTTLVPQRNIIGMKVDLLNSSWDDKTVWDGRVFRKETIEFTASGKKYTKYDNFRVYDDYEQCLTDYLMFMTYGANGRGCTPKYGDLMTERDPEKLISAVAGRGYCTDPGYPKSIMAIIDKWGLQELDGPIEYKGEHISVLAPRTIIDITDKNKAPRSRSEKIKWIVVHYLGVPNADNPYLYNGGYGGHYNVQRNGEIYKAVNPKTGVVWHCGGANGAIQGESKDSDGVAPHRYYGICTNANSIGIECGVCYAGTEKSPSGTSDKWYFTAETQASLVWLVSKLMDEYGIAIDHVIRHFDVTGKCCPNPYVRNNHFMTNWTWPEFIANVKQFRKEGTITLPDGKTIVDPETPEPTPSTGGYMFTPSTVKKGSQGASVKLIQTLLKGLGYTNIDGSALKIDSDAGSNTVNAITEYQMDVNLAADGIAGKNTWSKIIGL